VAHRAFVSFQLEDRWARDFLAKHSRDKNIPFEYLDYSVKEPFESAWKTNAKARIGQTRGTIVLIGAGTHRSEAVLWEIAESKRQGNPVFGIQINRDETHAVPQGVSKVCRWDFDAIARELNRW
jgi:hypothetical protein